MNCWSISARWPWSAKILAGIILGPAVLGLIHTGPELKVLSDLGVFMMIVLAGMGLDFADIGDALRGRGRWIPLINFFLPFGAGSLLGPLLGMEGTQAVFLGLCVAIMGRFPTGASPLLI